MHQVVFPLAFLCLATALDWIKLCQSLDLDGNWFKHIVQCRFRPSGLGLSEAFSSNEAIMDED